MHFSSGKPVRDWVLEVSTKKECSAKTIGQFKFGDKGEETHTTTFETEKNSIHVDCNRALVVTCINISISFVEQFIHIQRWVK